MRSNKKMVMQNGIVLHHHLFITAEKLKNREFGELSEGKSPLT